MVVAIWGSTFVFTKLLLLGGLTPGQIFTQRFIIAYHPDMKAFEVIDKDGKTKALFYCDYFRCVMA